MESNKDIYFANRIYRYNKDNILSHIIGYINKSENRGETGIEKVYDEILTSIDNGSLFLEADDRKNIIFGGGIYSWKRNRPPNIPNGVKLTIDYNVQKVVEDI